MQNSKASKEIYENILKHSGHSEAEVQKISKLFCDLEETMLLGNQYISESPMQKLDRKTLIGWAAQSGVKIRLWWTRNKIRKTILKDWFP